MRYFIELSYDGTNYAGWQKQPNAPTIQGSLEDALKVLYQKEITVTGCGRTDAGVHACHYIAHADIYIEDEHQAGRVLYKLNHLLSSDIACHSMTRVADDRHARFDAKSRQYQYRIHLQKNPFIDRFSTYVSFGKRINFEILKEIDELIMSTKDFTSFCKAHSDATTMICKIYQSEWSMSEDGQNLIYTVKANRFLRGMVRLIVGSALNVATGKFSMKDLKAHITRLDRHPLMKSAPAQGLALTEITY